LDFVERNSFDVRANVFRMAHRDHPLVFELYPMVHLAAPEFYEAIGARLKMCDTILYEGVKGITTRILTSAYQLAGGSSRLGLVTQDDALPLAKLPKTLIHADLSGQEFDRGWRQIPIVHRLLVYLLAPIVGLGLRFAGTRQLIAQGLRVDDLSVEEAYGDEDSGWDAMERVIVDLRDRHLVGVLRTFFEQHRSQSMTAAVVFGARHIPAAARALMSGCGYRVARADAVIVFQLVDNGAV
jgi:hypothetical protein